MLETWTYGNRKWPLLAFVLAVLIGFFGAAALAHADTLFADDFESGLTGWTLTGTPDLYNGTPANGTYSVQLSPRESLQRTRSTRGYQDVAVSFSLGAAHLSRNNSHLDVSWYNGSSWTLLARLTRRDAQADGQLHSFSFSLPAGADDNPAFALRASFSGKPGSADCGYLDDVTVQGTPRRYAVTVASAGHGAVRVNGEAVTLPWSDTVPYGTELTLQAVPDVSYRFGAWTGGAYGSKNPLTLAVGGDLDITANFVVTEHVLTLTGAGGSVSVNGETHALPWSGIFTSGASVVLQALPATGHVFDGWAGDFTETTNPVTVVMNQDWTLDAQFSALRYTVAILGDGAGSVVVDGVNHALPWSADYDYGTVLQVEAYPEDSTSFASWSGDLSGTTNPAFLTVTGEASFTAHFTLNSYTLDLAGTGGRVLVNGVSQRLPWSGVFDYGTEVTLEAVANLGSHFGAWTGDLCGIDNPLTLTMTSDLSLTAYFVALQKVLYVAGVGGSVEVDGVPHSLPWVGIFSPGASVTLHAVPDPGHEFSGWTGDLADAPNPTTVTMEADRVVAAAFETLNYEISLAGEGPGTVSVNGEARSLPWTGAFPYGTVVVLQAAPEAHCHFVDWTGDFATTANPAFVFVNGDKSITAHFAVDTFAVRIGAANGGVLVNGDPVSLPWSSTVPYGTALSLTAVPDSGYRFGVWTGSAYAADNPLALTVTTDLDLTAQCLSPSQYVLRLTGTEGAVRVAGVTHALPWAGVYDSGASVTMTALPPVGKVMCGWTGDVTDQANPLTLVLESDLTLSPDFRALDGLFSDVTPGFWAEGQIAACYYAGIVSGYRDGTYHPEWTVNRGQMAAFIARAMAHGESHVPSPPAGAQSFTDIAPGHWAYKYIEYNLAHGVASGYRDGTYHPEWSVNRGQMAVYIAHAIAGGEEGLAGYTPPTTPSFTDVPADFWAYKHIEYCKAYNVVRGYKDGTYHPEWSVNRGQMAVYIAAAFQLLF